MSSSANPFFLDDSELQIDNIDMKRAFPLLIFLIGNMAFAHKVYLFSGGSFRTQKIQFNGSTYTLDDTTLSRGDVKAIIVEQRRKPKAAKEEKKRVSTEIKEILTKADTARKYFADASFIVLLDQGRDVLREDGTRLYRYHFQGIIMKPERLDEASVLLPFEEDMEKVSVILARTIKPDGTVIDLNPSEIKITKASSGSVYFGKEKHLAFTLPSVSVGDIIEYIFEYDVFNPWDKKVFSPDWYFGGDDPVYHSEVEYIVPANQELVYVIKHDPHRKVKHEITEEGNTRIYRFWADSIPKVVEEPYMPPVSTLVPSLHASNLKSWDYVFDWYARFQRERMKVTPEIKALADSLVRDAKTEDDSIAAIYHWVQRNIRYISIKGAAASGVSGHPAWETLKNGYGDCTDKSILFSTLLKAIGIEAYPVYLETNDSGELIPEIPGFQGNHCITEVIKKNGENIFLDATGTTSRYPSFWSADHGCWAINAIKRKIEKIPVPPPHRNLRHYEYRMELDSLSNLHVHYRSSYRGDWEDGVRWYWEHVKEEEVRDRLSEMVHEIAPDAELISYELVNLHDISKPFSIVMEYVLHNYLDRAGDLYLLKLPEIEDRYRLREVSLKKRNYDIFYGTSMMIEDVYSLEIPEDFELAYIPQDTVLRDGNIYYKLHVERDGNRVVYRGQFVRPDNRIPVSEYESYREFLHSVRRLVKKPFIFKRR